jgi:histidinol-phosphate aminotransferase
MNYSSRSEQLLDERRMRLPRHVVHGGVTLTELRALGLKPKEVLDFSTSVSPLGLPDGVWEAIFREDLTAYPDPECLKLREAIADYLSAQEPGLAKLGVERIQIGNGSTELIHLLTRAYLSPPLSGTVNVAFLLTPTYGEYEGACRLAGAISSAFVAQRRDGFRWNLREACRIITAQRPSLVFLCNPNNPTGVYLQKPEVEALADAAAGVGAMVVIDEAYVTFVSQPWNSLELLERDNIVLLRSMTKDYALTGLRLGYILAPKPVVDRLSILQPAWSVNQLAQVAGVVALNDSDYLPRVRAAVAQGKDYLMAKLSNQGITVFPSAANFLLAEVGDGSSLRGLLGRQGLFVRDCASFGLPECIRVGIRAMSDCERLVRAMEEVL